MSNDGAIKYDPSIFNHFKVALNSQKMILRANNQRNGHPIFVKELRGAETGQQGDLVVVHKTKEVSGNANLSDVEAALLRCENGTFGICVGCGHQIPLDRLEAIPSASLCVPCHMKHKSG